MAFADGIELLSFSAKTPTDELRLLDRGATSRLSSATALRPNYCQGSGVPQTRGLPSNDAQQGQPTPPNTGSATKVLRVRSANSIFVFLVIGFLNR